MDRRLDAVRDKTRFKHYSIRTEQPTWNGAGALSNLKTAQILGSLGPSKSTGALPHLAVARQVAAPIASGVAS